MPDATTTDWLKSSGLVASAVNGGAAAFGDLAVDSEGRSPFDTAGAADAEAARQIAFLGPPRVIEQLRVAGRRVDLIGKAVTLTAQVAGYDAGLTVFVIGAEEIDGDDGTLLEVIRRL